jgi:hypothetical protein
MDRRSFLRTAMIGAAALGTSQLGALPPSTLTRKHWVWITLDPDRPPDEW